MVRGILVVFMAINKIITLGKFFFQIWRSKCFSLTHFKELIKKQVGDTEVCNYRWPTFLNRVEVSTWKNHFRSYWFGYATESMQFFMGCSFYMLCICGFMCAFLCVLFYGFFMCAFFMHIAFSVAVCLAKNIKAIVNLISSYMCTW